MRRLRLLSVVVLVAGGLAVAAGDAVALAPAVADCKAHNRLTHPYTVAELRSALASIPADLEEYTVCYGVIQNQLYALIGNKKVRPSSKAASGSGGSSGTLILIIVVVVILLVGGGLAVRASRRRGDDGPGGGGPQAPTAGS